MNESRAPYNEIDAYIATFTPQEREELAAAEAALDLAVLLYRARGERGLSQAAAARLAGVQQQAVSRLERPRANLQLDTMRRYLEALGYSVEIAVREATTGKELGRATLPPLKRSVSG